MPSLKHLLASCMVAVLSCSAEAAENKTVTVVTEPSFAPFEFVEKDTTKLIGFDIDIINAICETQGYKAQVSSMGFDAQIPAILTHQTDIAISGFTITKERAKMVAFSEPYYDAGLGALISPKHVDKIKSKDDLHDITVCAQIGTSGAMFAQKLSGADVKQFNTSADAFLELEKGSCEVVISDKPVIEYYVNTSGKTNLKMLKEQLTVEQYGIVSAKDRQEITTMIAEGLKKIREDGTYDKIYKKWFGEAK